MPYILCGAPDCLGGKGLRGCEVRELGGQGAKEDLGGVGGGENVIRIYHKIFSNICLHIYQQQTIFTKKYSCLVCLGNLRLCAVFNVTFSAKNQLTSWTPKHMPPLLIPQRTSVGCSWGNIPLSHRHRIFLRDTIPWALWDAVSLLTLASLPYPGEER